MRNNTGESSDLRRAGSLAKKQPRLAHYLTGPSSAFGAADATTSGNLLSRSERHTGMLHVFYDAGDDHFSRLSPATITSILRWIRDDDATSSHRWTGGTGLWSLKVITQMAFHDSRTIESLVHRLSGVFLAALHGVVRNRYTPARHQLSRSRSTPATCRVGCCTRESRFPASQESSSSGIPNGCPARTGHMDRFRTWAACEFKPPTARR